jgi:serine/threonine protein phosphatase PrpC
MSESPAQVAVETAAVSDRGLSEKRPHNEDSYLLDAERRVFAVADGVGGAKAGEVASQTAVEVLAEAFRHHRQGEDAEDLMEIAFQRANASIFQMSREQTHLASMATTIVALHLDGNRATVGHVGDSRLYRLLPAGRLQRETEDHSVVEEEVRAGRMTAEQAANHPSRNVISRALGAESSVEVDLKTFEIDEGTVFLLCSDGITRHIPDDEIGSVLRGAQTLEAACAEMKRRCYERGAEDNLTAVAVRFGARSPAHAPAGSDAEERTLNNPRPARGATVPAAAALASQAAAQPQGAAPTTAAASASASASDANTGRRSRISGSIDEPAREEPPPEEDYVGVRERSPVGRAGSWLGVILFLLLVGMAAFYGGLRYQQTRAGEGPSAALISQPTPAPTPLDSYAEYLRQRDIIDSSPAAEAAGMAAKIGGQPLDTADPQFLVLYGRALFLAGRNAEAVAALRVANQKIDSAAPPVRDAVKVDARLMLAAAALKTEDAATMREAAQSLSSVVAPAQTAAPAQQPGQPFGASPQPAASPSPAP